MSEELVTYEEYEGHRKTCGKSFDDINAQLATLNMAMFGDEKLDQLGVLKMTKEMYDSVMTAKGGKKIFWATVRMAGALSALTGAFWLLYGLVKSIISR